MAGARLMDWKEVLRPVESGEADVIAIVPSEERIEQFDFTEPVCYMAHGIFSDDLTALRVAAANGGYAQIRLRNRPDETELVPWPNIHTASGGGKEPS